MGEVKLPLADPPQPDLSDLHFTLYVFPFSLYSIIARFTISLASHYHEGPQGLPKITHKLVNLHRDENLEEWYLITINPQGQVPVLVSESDAFSRVSKIAGSLAISRFFCGLYFPKMIPEEHRVTIEDCLEKIHAIVALSLSVKDPDEDDKIEIRNKNLDELLARKDISTTYRRVLEYKQA